MIGNNQLNCALGASVRVRGADGAVFGDGDHVGNSSGVAIDSRGRGEYNVGDIVLGHAAEESDCPADVDAVVFEGNFTRFADSLYLESAMRRQKWVKGAYLESGEMNDTVNIGIGSKDLI